MNRILVLSFSARTALSPAGWRSPARGSVLIVAMMIAGIIGISLASYLKLSITSLNSANRSFYANSSVDYAEIGIEQAMACFYNVTAGTAAATAWSGWTLNSGTNEATRTFPTTSTYYTPGPGARAQVRVYVFNYTYSGAPYIVAKAIITPASGNPIEKYVRTTLRSRSLFSNGLVAKNIIDWAGHPSADSWNSKPDPAAAAVPYSVAVRLANCTVGCVSATNGAIDLANGTVMGNVATGGGTVAGSATITGTVSNDFSATFPAVSVPSPVTVNSPASSVSGTTTFPSAAVGTAINAADSTYYYNFGSAYNIDINGGGKNIQIVAGTKVVFILNNHANNPAIGIGGNAFMNVNAGASLKIYTNGNLTMAGNGVANSNVEPASLQIYGTRTTTGQTITVSGNGQLRAAVYAPFAAVTANGGGASGQIQGSIVAESIDMNGGPDFHYDQALGNLGAGVGVGVSQWKELQTAAERAVYASKFP